MKQVKVSFIIPVYNLESKVTKCANSLLAQTLQEVELIFVNDCSTDNSSAVLHHLAESHENVRIIDLKTNMKQGGARNSGLDAAQGEFIIFVDGDDYVEPEMAQALYEYAMKEGCDIVDSDYFQEDNNGRTEYRVSIPAEVIESKSKANLILNSGRLWTKIIRRELLVRNRIRFIEHKKFEDNPYLPITISYAQRVGKIPIAFYHYIYNPESASRIIDDYTTFDRLDTAKYMLQSAKERGVYQRFREEYEYLYIQLYYINTIVACITKFRRLPSKKVNELYRSVKDSLPYYRKNIYISTSPKYIRYILRLHRVSLLIFCKIVSISYHHGFRRFIVREAKN